MRRFLVSVAALSLGLVMGCQLIGDGFDCDCCCESCGCADGAAGLPAPPMGPAASPAGAMPKGPENLKEMPKVLDKTSDEAPVRLAPETEGLDLK